MAGSEQDLGTLMMAEVDVPLEDMPDSCDDAGEKLPLRPCSHADTGPTPPAPQHVVDKVSSAPAVASTPMTAPASSALTSLPLSTAPSNATRGAAPSHAPLRAPAAATAGGAATSTPPVMPPPTKSKKKKSAAAAALALGKDAVDKGENVGRWTAEEHRLFLQGLEQHGKGWKKIASLIKTRSVVQIRTHAQKYFQKLAKARQNGEEGDVTMEGRGGISSAASLSTIVAAHTNKRRRPATGTKRKVIQSIVGSAIRQGKKLAALELEAGFQDAMPPLPAVAPILAHFIIPSLQTGSPDEMNNAGGERPVRGNTSGGATLSTQGIISGPSLEDSIFRFLTPAPVTSCSVEPQGSDIARQAGAYPITLPSTDVDASALSGGLDVDGGEVSPTSVADLTLYPSWIDAKDTPTWYAKGADVDALLEVGEALDWLQDTGDLNETYDLSSGGQPTAGASDLPDIGETAAADRSGRLGDESRINSASATILPRVDSNVGAVVPPLPSLFDGAGPKKPDDPSPNVPPEALDIQVNLSPGATTINDEHLQVFENPMEEQEFVSTILETE